MDTDRAENTKAPAPGAFAVTLERNDKPKPVRRHHCAYCGKDMGEYDRRYCDPTDTCGEKECERSARDAAQQEREEAHEQLDRDMGWDSW